MWPVRLVVVVLPFDPVMPMMRPCRNGAASSTSPITVTPRARAASSGGRSAGTSGESTIRSQPSNTASVWTANGMSRPRASGSWSSGFRSVARTTAPSRRSSSTEATPDFFIPTTSALVITAAERFAGIAHLSFNVVSANSASTSPAIQKRAIIFDSAQPSASK